MTWAEVRRTMRSGRLLPPARPLPAGAAELRSEVRSFLAAERAAEMFIPACDAWLSGHSPVFSRRLAEHGWVGMTWPKRYGGHERSQLERYMVLEELLASTPFATPARTALQLSHSPCASVSGRLDVRAMSVRSTT